MIIFKNASHLHYLRWVMHDKRKKKRIKSGPNKFIGQFTIFTVAHTHSNTYEKLGRNFLKWKKKKNCRPTRDGYAQSKMFTRQPMQRQWKTPHNERCICFVQNRVGASALNAVDQRRNKTKTKKKTNDTTNNEMNKPPSERTVLKMKPNKLM